MVRDGVMMEDEDGNLYFLRPEILKAAKLPKALHKDAQTALKAAKRKPKPKLKVVGALTLVRAKVGRNADPTRPGELSAKARTGAAVRVRRIKTPRRSTIMCPW